MVRGTTDEKYPREDSTTEPFPAEAEISTRCQRMLRPTGAFRIPSSPSKQLHTRDKHNINATVHHSFSFVHDIRSLSSQFGQFGTLCSESLSVSICELCRICRLYKSPFVHEGKEPIFDLARESERKESSLAST